MPILLAGCGGSLSHPSAPEIQSTFDTDVEGWTLEGFDTDAGNYALGQLTAEPALYDPSGAAMRHETFFGNTDYFVAPAKFLGDLSSYDGGTLRYTVRDSQVADPFSAALVMVDGAGSRWRYDGAATAQVTVTPFAIPFDGGSDWTRIEGTTSFHDALSGMTALRIRGEFSSDLDDSWLDDVVLTP